MREEGDRGWEKELKRDRKRKEGKRKRRELRGKRGYGTCIEDREENGGRGGK